MFEELFYFLYSVSRKIKAAKTPAWSSYLFVCVLIGVNLLTICNVVCYFLNVNLVRDLNFNSTFEGLILGSVIMIINYFTLFIRRQVIFDKYEAQPKNVKSKRSSFLLQLISIKLH